MKNIFVFYFIILGLTKLHSQNNTNKPVKVKIQLSDSAPKLSRADSDNTLIFSIVKVNAKFSGGDINKYFSENIAYPENSRLHNIQGTVYISFVVEKDGSVSSIKILRGLRDGRDLENEAIRVVATMPKWTPGSLNGHPVRQLFNVPIHFILQDDTDSKKKKPK